MAPILIRNAHSLVMLESVDVFWQELCRNWKCSEQLLFVVTICITFESTVDLRSVIGICRSICLPVSGKSYALKCYVKAPKVESLLNFTCKIGISFVLIDFGCLSSVRFTPLFLFHVASDNGLYNGKVQSVHGRIYTKLFVYSTSICRRSGTTVSLNKKYFVEFSIITTDAGDVWNELTIAFKSKLTSSFEQDSHLVSVICIEERLEIHSTESFHSNYCSRSYFNC